MSIRLFPYYGSKVKFGKKYPEPKYDTIIEPFAGAAGYSCNYFNKNVVLYETNYKVYSVIKYLIDATPNDILSLPLIYPGSSVDDFGLSDPEKWMIGFWLNNGTTSPSKSLSKWGKESWPNPPANFWGPKCRERLSDVVDKIKHWKVFNECCIGLIMQEATFFVDPPYQTMGIHYKNNKVDYKLLGNWCQSLPGQVIVCENEGADWLPFEGAYSIVGSGVGRNRQTEVIWIGGVA